ncbi:DNA repair protein RadC [candidate division WWE3 bacterium]|uniref:DNA repair protein RadC n=1 Tax=candidate division WWE3 bacterium TaxID=2053526 RepID=A0A7X9E6Q6_UNCKA|nr:DNA repair protein RadC [candidate division WWE3 bacterium]
MKIKDLQREEKPREKLIYKGLNSLTNVELLAIILRSGGKDCPATNLARDLLNKYSGLRNLLSADIQELTSFKNIGYAKASCIRALGEIAKRVDQEDHNIGSAIKKPGDVYSLVKRDLIGKDQEYLVLISLNSKSRLISKDVISKGTLTETLIHPREVFKKALLKNAYSIIIVHNHPSNEAFPSEDDIKVTRKISKVGTDIGIPLVDHLVVADKAFFSMKAHKLFSN